MHCLFATDLHGSRSRYDSLFSAIESEEPDAVFLGGDLLPNQFGDGEGFLEAVLAASFTRLSTQMGERYPHVFLILGNDDPRSVEPQLAHLAEAGLWSYVHARKEELHGIPVYGYSFVPPSPFLLKDWERYDVSRYVDPGSVSPEEGRRTVEADANDVRYGTILEDLASLVGDDDLSDAIFLFHAPPYQTKLDRAGLDGKTVEHVPLDVNVGSIAIRRLIERRQPRLTLHGHVHESARITGEWKDRIGRTVLLGGAHDGPELALIRFDPADPERATRELLRSAAA